MNWKEDETINEVKIQHPKVFHEGKEFRFKGSTSSGFTYECVKKPKGCKSNLKVSSNYIPVDLLKQHNKKIAH